MASKEVSSHDLVKAQQEMEAELSKVSRRHKLLTTECHEMEKLKGDLSQKKQYRDDKLKVIQEKQISKKEKSDRELEKVDTYSQRIKEFVGLSVVETASNSTVLIFNNIDKCDANREFLCEFTLDGPDKRTYKGNLINTHL